MAIWKFMPKPNFFILGAPKCGTTSLANWLSEHPAIFMCKPKEPQFFNTDYHSTDRPSSVAAYEALFADADDRHLAVGEASTAYLRSEVAVPAILDFAPDARFVVCLRNPVEMAVSVYAQLLKTGRELEKSFARAWDLQESRRRGEGIPWSCTEPKVLQYGHTCALGSQVEALLRHVARERVLFVLLESIAEDPRRAYLHVLEHLSLPDDGRIYFPVENERKVPRARLVTAALHSARQLGGTLGLPSRTGLGGLAMRLASRPPESQALSPEIRSKLNAFFEPEIHLLARTLDRDLSHWLGT